MLFIECCRHQVVLRRLLQPQELAYVKGKGFWAIAIVSGSVFFT